MTSHNFIYIYITLTKLYTLCNKKNTANKKLLKNHYTCKNIVLYARRPCLYPHDCRLGNIDTPDPKRIYQASSQRPKEADIRQLFITQSAASLNSYYQHTETKDFVITLQLRFDRLFYKFTFACVR